MERKRVIIDTDIGSDVDDALALALAAVSNEIFLDAVTVVGEEVEKRARLAKKVLSVAGIEDVEVAAGISRPLVRDGKEYWVRYGGHRVDIENLDLQLSNVNAVDLIVKKILESKKGLVLVTLGPLTNLAITFLIEPEIKKYIDEIFIMGGVVNRGTSIRPLIEYNLASDPEAANIVLQSQVPITLVGLDVTMKVKLFDTDLEHIVSNSTPLTRLVYRMTKHYHAISGRNFNYLHDPLTVGAILDRTLLSTEPMSVDIETEGRFTSRWTIANPSNNNRTKANANVALDVDVEKFRKLFISRLMRGVLKS